MDGLLTSCKNIYYQIFLKNQMNELMFIDLELRINQVCRKYIILCRDKSFEIN